MKVDHDVIKASEWLQFQLEKDGILIVIKDDMYTAIDRLSYDDFDKLADAVRRYRVAHHGC